MTSYPTSPDPSTGIIPPPAGVTPWPPVDDGNGHTCIGTIYNGTESQWGAYYQGEEDAYNAYFPQPDPDTTP